MNKFLSLCESYDPVNVEKPKWKLLDYLQSKGINASSVRDSDLIYIDVGGQSIAVTVSETEEDAENISVGFGDYSVNDEVEKLADTAKKGPLGLIARKFGTAPQRAKQAVQKRRKMSAQAVNAYDQATNRLQKTLSKMQKQNAPMTY